VESDGVLGGTAPSALVHSVCGLYELHENHAGRCADEPASEPEPVRFANRGFAEEFAGRLLAAGAAYGPVRLGRVDVLLQHPGGFAYVADELARTTPGLEVLFHTSVTRADANGAATLFCRGRTIEVQAQAVVDATGDGCIAALCGADFEQESAARLQRPAFIFALSGVPASAVDDDRRLKIAARVAAAVRDERLPTGALGAALAAVRVKARLT
jgi:hypothetical protein